MRTPRSAVHPATLARPSFCMPDSVLYSAELPAFDRATGQLSLAAHHLISAPLSFLDLSPPGSTLLFDQPPAHPYQQPVLVDDQPDGSAPHRSPLSRCLARRLRCPTRQARPPNDDRPRVRRAPRGHCARLARGPRGGSAGLGWARSRRGLGRRKRRRARAVAIEGGTGRAT